MKIEDLEIGKSYIVQEGANNPIAMKVEDMTETTILIKWETGKTTRESKTQFVQKYEIMEKLKKFVTHNHIRSMN